MEAAESMHEDEPQAEDKKRAKDGELPEALKEHQFEAKDRKAKDAEEEEEDPVADARKKAHDALDRALDSRVGDKRRGKDADIEELKNLLDEFLDEEEDEPEHAKDRKSKDDDDDMGAEDVDTEELEKTLKGEDAEDCPDCGEAMDECECADSESDPGEEEVESGEEEVGDSPDPDSDDDQADVEAKDRSKAKDRARAADGATAVLRMLRPVVARSGDKAIHNAVNRALDSVKKSSRVTVPGAGYGAFASSARARDKAPRNPNPDRARASDGKGYDPIAKMQEFYNSAHKGGK